MKNILIALFIFITPLGLTAGDKPFLGEISYTLTYSGDNAEMLQMMSFTGYQYTFGDGKVRLKMTGGMFESYMGVFVINPAEDLNFLQYDDEQTVYSLDNVEEDAAATEGEDVPEDEVTVMKGNEREKIMGYKCQQYFVTTKSGDEETTQEYWIAEDIQVNTGDGINMGNSLVLEGVSGFPLRIVTEVEGQMVVQEATVVQEYKPSDSMFQIPEGYAVKDYSESPIMQMGGGE